MKCKYGVTNVTVASQVAIQDGGIHCPIVAWQGTAIASPKLSAARFFRPKMHILGLKKHIWGNLGAQLKF